MEESYMHMYIVHCTCMYTCITAVTKMSQSVLYTREAIKRTVHCTMQKPKACMSQHSLGASEFTYSNIHMYILYMYIVYVHVHDIRPKNARKTIQQLRQSKTQGSHFQRKGVPRVGLEPTTSVFEADALPTKLPRQLSWLSPYHPYKSMQEQGKRLNLISR